MASASTIRNRIRNNHYEKPKNLKEVVSGIWSFINEYDEKAFYSEEFDVVYNSDSIEHVVSQVEKLKIEEMSTTIYPRNAIYYAVESLITVAEFSYYDKNHPVIGQLRKILKDIENSHLVTINEIRKALNM